MKQSNVVIAKTRNKLIALLAIILVAGVGITGFWNFKTRADEERAEQTEAAEAEEAGQAEEETAAAVPEQAQDEEAQISGEGAEAQPEAEIAEAVETEAQAPAEAPEGTETEDGLWLTQHIDLFGADLLIPNLTAGPVDSAVKAGTIATEENGLAFYYVEGDAVDTDVYVKNFNAAYTHDQFEQFIGELQQSGFTGSYDDYDGAQVYTASRDGLCVIVESIPECNYSRISYYSMPEGGIHGSQIAFLG